MLATLEPYDLALAPPPALAARLAKRAGQLRMLPAVATDALELAKDPECSIAEFAAIVERDVKLAMDMLRIANSAFYSPSKPIVDLKRAVLRLGFRECQYLIMTACIASLMNRMSLEQEWIRGAFWRHSFHTAMLANHLNRTFHLGFQGKSSRPDCCTTSAARCWPSPRPSNSSRSTRWTSTNRHTSWRTSTR